LSTEIEQILPQVDLWDSFDLVQRHRLIEQPPSTATFIVFTKANRYYVKEGSTGRIIFEEPRLDHAETAIQMALNALPAGGGAVVLMGGDYWLSDSLFLRKSNTYLRGCGWGTRLAAVDGLNKSLVEIGDGSTTFEDIWIGDLQVHGRKLVQTSGHGIFFNKFIKNAGLDRVFLRECKNDGVQVNECTDIYLHRVKSWGNDGHGFSLIGETGGFGTGRYSAVYCIAERNGEHGFNIRIAPNPRLVECKAISNSQIGAGWRHGVEVYSDNAIIIGGDFFDDQPTKTQGYGIVIRGIPSGFDPPAQNCAVIGVRIIDNRDGHLLDEGFNTVIVPQTYGYRGKTQGHADIPAGTSSVTLWHGLSKRPSAIEVKPTWVTGYTITSTDKQFTVVFDTPPATFQGMKWECHLTRTKTAIPWISLDAFTTAGDTGYSVGIAMSRLRLATGAAADYDALAYSNDSWVNLVESDRQVVWEIVLDYLSYVTAQRIWLRFESSVADPPSETVSHFGWRIDDGAVYASNADGTTQQLTDTGVALATGVQRTRLKVILTPGSKCEFYINDILKATHTANLPTAGHYYLHFQIRTLEAVAKAVDIGLMSVEKEN